jgi:DNA-binding NtrC family response regulator
MPPARQSTIYIAEDEAVTRKLIHYQLEQAGLYSEAFSSGQDLLQAVHEDLLVCVLDMNMPGLSGMETMKRLRKTCPWVEVVFLTTVNQVEDAVQALKAGAFDYQTKPFEPANLVRSTRQALKLATANRDNTLLRSGLVESSPQADFVGESTAMKRVKELVGRIGASEETVLLTGESGTGKTMLARMLHQSSRRASGPFVSVSCPSLPRDLLESELFGHEKGAFSGAVKKKAGRAELAHGGTLFLDEIGDLPLELQPKLLTFLQERVFYRLGGDQPVECDVRIMAATNRDLRAEVDAGRFREDLYFRLNVLPIEVPSLREHREDVIPLAEKFIRLTADRSGETSPKLTPSALEKLTGYDWPGNVRELENCLARAFVLRRVSSEISGHDIVLADVATRPPEATQGPSDFSGLAGMTLAEIEKHALIQTLAKCGQNRSKAARMLGVAEKTIYNKMSKYDLS